MKRTFFIFLTLIFLPSQAFAEGFYDREAKAERQNWWLFIPQEMVEKIFPVEDQEVTATPDYRMTINLPARRLFLYEKNIPIKIYPVAVGTNRYGTPVGSRYLTNGTGTPGGFRLAIRIGQRTKSQPHRDRGILWAA